MLVAVGVQPVFAAQCQYGACGTENDPGIGFLMSSVQMDKGEHLKELSGALLQIVGGDKLIIPFC